MIHTDGKPTIANLTVPHMAVPNGLKRAQDATGGDVLLIGSERRTVASVDQWAGNVLADTVEIAFDDGSAEVLPASDLVEVCA